MSRARATLVVHSIVVHVQLVHHLIRIRWVFDFSFCNGKEINARPEILWAWYDSWCQLLVVCKQKQHIPVLVMNHFTSQNAQITGGL